MRHMFVFGDAMKEEKNSIDWETIRKDGGPAFRMADTREAFLESVGEGAGYKNKMNIISPWIKQGSKVCSLGCGRGGFEYFLKRERPDLYLCCSDYTERALEKLKQIFVECDCFKTFDMRGNYNEMKMFDYLIMHRVSTEFKYNEWRDIFRKCNESGIKNIIFIPSELMKVKDIFREKLMWIKWRMRGEKPIFAGWMYSEKEFMKMWENLYECRSFKHIDDTAVYLLNVIVHKSKQFV